MQSNAVLAEVLTQSQADFSVAIARTALPYTRAKDCRSTFAPSSKLSVLIMYQVASPLLLLFLP